MPIVYLLAMNEKIKKQNLELCKQIAVLGSPIRLRILQILTEREHCACEFPDLLEISQPNTSRNLNVLKRAGLISSYRDGQRIIYSLQIDKLKRMQESLNELIDSYLGLSFVLPEKCKRHLK